MYCNLMKLKLLKLKTINCLRQFQIMYLEVPIRCVPLFLMINVISFRCFTTAGDVKTKVGDRKVFNCAKACLSVRKKIF